MPDRVVDASVLAAVAFIEPRAQEAKDLLLGATLHAPMILPIDLCSVALKKARLQPGQTELLELGLRRAALLIIDLVAVEPRDVLRLALATKLSAYDAAYLHVAQQLDCEVITFDKKLAAAARAMRV